MSSGPRRGPPCTATRAPVAEEQTMQKIKTFLWFDNEAEEAAHYYISIFEGTRGAGRHASSAGPGPRGRS